MPSKSTRVLALIVLAILSGCTHRDSQEQSGAVELLNVSYDPTRELWRDINENFIARCAKESFKSITIKQSHGGSSTQARAVIDGLDADVVTLASYLDTDAISKKGLIKPGWVDQFPNHSLPYTSTII